MRQYKKEDREAAMARLVASIRATIEEDRQAFMARLVVLIRAKSVDDKKKAPWLD